MYNIYSKLFEYMTNTQFRVWQNSLAQTCSTFLKSAYSAKMGEVKMVTEMAALLSDQSHREFHLSAKKVHGSASIVEYNHLGKDTRSELADLVIISLITQKRNILLEKTALIQFKKETAKSSWAIQQNQLHLLHNFPAFNGVRGIVKNTFGNPVNLLDTSKSLGQYCLLKEPGDLILATARSVAQNQINNSVSANDLFSNDRQHMQTPSSISFPFAFIDHPDWVMLLDEFGRLFSRGRFYPEMFSPIMHNYFGFLQNISLSMNIYEFIRNLTLFNVGDTARYNKQLLDNQLSQFNRTILRASGLGERYNLDGNEEGFSIDTDLLVVSLDLAE